MDYHIYIHSDNSAEFGSNTKPFSSGSSGTSAFKAAKTDTDVENAAETGSSFLSKVAPVVAVAVAGAKVADKVLTIGFSHLNEYTGHYEYEVAYNNFKTSIRHVMNPIGYLKMILHQNAQWKLQNRKIQEDARLLGKTVYDDVRIGV